MSAFTIFKSLIAKPVSNKADFVKNTFYIAGKSIKKQNKKYEKLLQEYKNKYNGRVGAYIDDNNNIVAIDEYNDEYVYTDAKGIVKTPYLNVENYTNYPGAVFAGPASPNNDLPGQGQIFNYKETDNRYKYDRLDNLCIFHDLSYSNKYIKNGVPISFNDSRLFNAEGDFLLVARLESLFEKNFDFGYNKYGVDLNKEARFTHYVFKFIAPKITLKWNPKDPFLEKIIS